MKRVETPPQSVAGGQFDSVGIAQVPLGAWARLVNFVSFNKRINRRDGSVLFSLNAAPANFQPISAIPILNFANGANDLGDYALVVGARSGTDVFGQIGATGLWDTGPIDSDVGGEIVDDEMPWKMITRNDRVYAVRRNAGIMKRIESDGFTNAGRPVPGTPLTGAASNGSGTLVPGDYIISYTYFDSATGYEGNESASLSFNITGPADTYTIDGESFDQAAAAVRTDKFGLYMTRVDGAIKFLIGYYTKGDYSAGNDLIVLAEPVGKQLETDNDQPLSSFDWVESWNERSWFLDSAADTIYPSPFNRYESFGAADGLQFDPKDGDKLIVAYAWGKFMVVAKKRKMMLFTGYDRSTWEKDTWTNEAGCVAPFSMRDCDGTLVWLGENGFYAATPDSRPKLISNDTVKGALKLIDKSRQDLAYAEVFPKLGLYLCMFPTKETFVGVAYNWSTSAWSEIQFPAAPRSLMLGFDGSGATRLFACMAGDTHIQTLLEGDTDVGSAIVAEAVSGAQKTADSGDLIGMISVGLLCAKTRYPVTVSVYGDGNADPLIEVEARLQGEEGWKWVGASTRHDVRSQVQFGIKYSGKDPFWISEVSVDTVTMQARREYH